MQSENNTHSQPFVLIIEKNTLLANQLDLVLKMAGFQSLPVSSVVEALTVLKKRLPDVIVSSVNLGTFSGFDLLLRLRSDYRYAHLPVVLMPDQFSEDELMLALDLKVTDILPKPFDAYDLVDVIHGALPQHAPARKAS